MFYLTIYILLILFLTIKIFYFSNNLYNNHYNEYFIQQFIFYFDEDYGMQEDLPDSGTTQSNHLAVIENHKKSEHFSYREIVNSKSLNTDHKPYGTL